MEVENRAILQREERINRGWANDCDSNPKVELTFEDESFAESRRSPYCPYHNPSYPCLSKLTSTLSWILSLFVSIMRKAQNPILTFLPPDTYIVQKENMETKNYTSRGRKRRGTRLPGIDYFPSGRPVRSQDR